MWVYIEQKVGSIKKKIKYETWDGKEEKFGGKISNLRISLSRLFWTSLTRKVVILCIPSHHPHVVQPLLVQDQM